MGIHCIAPPGLFVCVQSYLYSKWKYPASHLVGLAVHAPSNPEVITYVPVPAAVVVVVLPNVFFQPIPICSMDAPAGSGPTYVVDGAAPCALPKVCPPAISATVSVSFIPIRRNVSRISLAEASMLG